MHTDKQGDDKTAFDAFCEWQDRMSDNDRQSVSTARRRGQFDAFAEAVAAVVEVGQERLCQETEDRQHIVPAPDAADRLLDDLDKARALLSAALIGGRDRKRDDAALLAKLSIYISDAISLRRSELAAKQWPGEQMTPPEDWGDTDADS